MNPTNWLKIITLPQGTLHRSISKIQELLDESLDLLKSNLKLMNSVDSLSSLHKCLDQAFKSQSMPRSCALRHMLNFSDNKRKKQVWSQLLWLPSQWQSSVHLSGLTCSITFPLKLLGIRREKGSGGWYFFHSIYFLWSSGGQDDLRSLKNHIVFASVSQHYWVEKAITGQVKHERG